jgi:hypothetical protein
METRFERVAREQAERQAKRAKAQGARMNAEQAALRKAERARRAGSRERAYHEHLISDHNHEMDA